MSKPDQPSQARRRRLYNQAISCILPLNTLIRARSLYPKSIQEEEAQSLRGKLVAHLEIALDELGDQEVTQFYPRTDVDSWTTLDDLQAMLFMTHPDLVVEDGEISEGSIHSIRNVALETAPKTLQEVFNRIREILLRDCRIPEPHGDDSFQEPGRMLFLLEEYWGLLTGVVGAEMKAAAVYHPHYLHRIIVNLQDRINTCVARLGNLGPPAWLREDIEWLFDALLTDPDAIQACSEYAGARIANVSVWLEQLRLQIGTKAHSVTEAESAFIEIVRQQTRSYREAHEAAFNSVVELAQLEGAARGRGQSREPQVKQNQLIITKNEMLVLKVLGDADTPMQIGDLVAVLKKDQNTKRSDKTVRNSVNSLIARGPAKRPSSKIGAVITEQGRTHLKNANRPSDCRQNTG